MAHERYETISTDETVGLQTNNFFGVKTFNTTMFKSLEEFSPDCADEIITELISIFMEEAPKSVENLQKAIREKDLKKTQLAAHTLKGSCATIGVARTAALCASVEQNAFQGTLEGAEIFLSEIDTELKRAFEVLESLSAAH